LPENLQEVIFKVKLKPGRIGHKKFNFISMDRRLKILIVLVLACVVAGVVAMQVRNKELVQGKIFDSKKETTVLPDVKASLETEKDEATGNLKVRVTVQNIGEGVVSGENPYDYTLYVNDQIIFTNTDNFSEMGPGDSFSFVYPVDKELYKYGDKGTVKVVVDKNNKVKESNEDNNETVVEYSL